ncbi:Methyltransferase domain-containing protein [Thermoactinomyces sp. DSM 45891]|uniref:class I SAM-dependent methyltransferase n=1 Tax=Thermoactinomyces sp. DSM 45891 TaxID=1761907 RepID=UPI000923C83C|nr:class I SAM-dependent methyltransferase [Thermoactinomyces sp. DSM 45891]SFX59955.1 Methyltransferase domain-containing protein [Thermoactinomyces sp. DSM 45891]
MGRLREYFDSNNKRLIDKWVHYFDIYENHFGRFVNQKVNVLEIGVFHGGSLQMWKDYFGPQATIYGLDINPQCKCIEEDQIKIIIGDQGDRDFWRRTIPELPQFDIIIDDGGHYVHQQKITFEEMFPVLAENGVYLVEDLHTSYWSEAGGGLRNSNSFIEYSKNIVDSLNGWHQKPSNVDYLTTSIGSITYYDSTLVIEKKARSAPYRYTTGHLSY